MRFSLVCLLVFFLSAFTAIAQEDEFACPKITSKKALDLYKKGSDRKKYDKIKRLEFLREAIDEVDEFVDAHFLLSVEIIRTAKYQGTSWEPAEKHFRAVIEHCPDHHSDPYFYLGEIHLDREEYEKAMEYLKLFLQFESEDDKKFSRSYEKNYEQAKDDYRYAKFYAEVYNNPVPFDPKIVNDISSEVDEYLPMITPDNEFMYFTRKFVKKNRVRATSFESDKPIYIEKFSRANHLGESKFDLGEPMDEPFNEYEGFNYGGQTISIDNKHIFLTICKPGKRGYMNCDIYSSDHAFGYDDKTGLEQWRWTPLENLGPNVNGEFSWEGQPSLSADGNTLYFATAREDSRGIDIYKTVRGSDGEWTHATNLGEPINTEHNDKTPFIHSDSQTLYFASKGHIGFGGFDVFFTRMGEDGKWQQPKNIGYPINTRADEHGFVVSTDGKKVYLGSDVLKEFGTGLDIFSFDLYREARPKKVAFVKGIVANEVGEPLKDVTIELKNPKTHEVITVKADSVDGRFAIVQTLEDDEAVVLNIRAAGKAFKAMLVTTPQDVVVSKVKTEDTPSQTPKRPGSFVMKVEIMMEELEVGKPYKIDDILYATNSAEINPRSKLILDEFIAYLKGKDNLRIAIHGHTDDHGTSDENHVLSHDRAYSVLAYLQENGIGKSRLSFKGFGEDEPVASNDTPEGRSLNRRTEFVVLSN